MKPSMTTAVALVAALSAVPARSEETSREQVRAEAASAIQATPPRKPDAAASAR